MPTRPSQLPEWATAGTNIVEPASGRKIAGWLPRMRPPAQYCNWWKNLVYRWVSWLDAETKFERHARVAHALTHSFSATDILSSGHNWHAGAVSDMGSNGLVSPRYWVVGDNGSGDTAIAYAQAGVAGGSWANTSGSAQAGSLDRCAAAGTLCMGIDNAGSIWKLGGSASEQGNLSGHTFRDVIHDPTRDQWVAITSAGIYTSPMTSVAWTQRQAWASARCVAHYGGRLVAAGDSGIYYSTDGINWTAGYADASSAWVDPSAIAANSLGFWIIDGATPDHIWHTVDGVTVTELTPAVDGTTERIFCWHDLICLPGVYMTRDPRLNEWSGASFSFGAGERFGASAHGAIACQGSSSAIVFGPTVDLAAVPFAT